MQKPDSFLQKDLSNAACNASTEKHHPGNSQMATRFPSPTALLVNEKQNFLGCRNVDNHLGRIVYHLSAGPSFLYSNVILEWLFFLKRMFKNRETLSTPISLGEIHVFKRHKSVDALRAHDCHVPDLCKAREEAERCCCRGTVQSRQRCKRSLIFPADV